MRWLRACLLATLCAGLVVVPVYANGILQWGTCAAGPALITDANSSGGLVAVGSLVELWDTQSNQIIATAHIGDGFYPKPPGRVVKLSQPADGTYTLQMIVYNVADPYAPDVESCAAIVGGAGLGTAGLLVSVSALYPSNICFPSAEIPTGTFSAGQGGGCQVLNPLAVTVASFEAFAVPDGVLVRWETASEIENAGFNLYRAESASGPWSQLNAGLIPSQGPGSPVGYLYEYLDGDVSTGNTYFYLLEDVSLTGQTTQHGPVSVAYLGTPTAVRLVGLDARSLASGGLWAVLLAVASALAVVVTAHRRRTG